MTRSLSRVRGFTLVELLVVIAVIGVLVALLLPAVQKVRESANMSVCQNNMKQLALAANAYQDANGTLPAGMDSQMTSALAYLLPYIDQLPIYQRFSFSQNTGFNSNDPGNLYPAVHAMWWDNVQNCPQPAPDSFTSTDPYAAGYDPGPPWSNGSGIALPAGPIPPIPNWTSNLANASAYAMSWRIKTFECPSAPDPENNTMMFLCSGFNGKGGVYNYGYNPFFVPGFGGCHDFAAPPASDLRGTTHYVACAGDAFGGGYLSTVLNQSLPYNSGYEGMFWYNKPRSLGAIPDGVSNTIAFLEWHMGYTGFFANSYGWPANQFPPGWCGRTWVGGYDYTSWGTCPNSQTSLIADAWQITGSWSLPLPSWDPNANQCVFYPPGAPYFSIGYNQAGSLHVNNIIHIAMGDGSVHAMNPGIAFSVFLALGGYADGVTVDVPD